MQAAELPELPCFSLPHNLWFGREQELAPPPPGCWTPAPGMHPLPPQALLLLSSLCARGVLSGSSLRYFTTAIEGAEPSFPKFFAVSYLDDIALDWFDSKAQVLEPRALWMKEAVGPDFWLHETLVLRQLQKSSMLILNGLMRQTNQMQGVHTYQVMEGCEVTEQNTTLGIFKSAFDMKDFLYLDSDTREWTAKMPEAEGAARANNVNSSRTEQYLEYLHWLCDVAEYLISFANKTLQRKVKPGLMVTERLSNDSATLLYCCAHGFHPRHVQMRWLRNGAGTQAQLVPQDILPNPDGTYKAVLTLRLEPESRDDYSCLVRHSSLKEDAILPWERKLEPGKGTGTAHQGLPVGGIIGIALAVVTLVSALTLGLVSWLKRRRTAVGKHLPGGIVNMEAPRKLRSCSRCPELARGGPLRCPLQAGVSDRRGGTPEPGMYPLLLPLLLSSLCARGVLSVGDSMRYLSSAITDTNSSYSYFYAVLLLDDIPLGWYDSLTQVMEPRAAWMKEAVGPGYWVRRTALMWYQEQLSFYMLDGAMNSTNQTEGVHTYQVMQGCNVTEHNTTVGFYRSAFDMENFLHINTTSMNWTAEMPQAEAEVEARNANWTITQQELKNLNMFCDYAKYLASFANQTLQRKEKPRVRVTERRLSNVTMSVYCRAYGFHPGLIRMTWLKDGAETQARLAPEDVLPSPDGTYQAFVYLFIVSETPANYSCLVQHSSLREDAIVPWERAPRTEPSPEPGKGTGTAQQGLSTGGIIGVVVAVVVFVSALTLGLVSWQKRRRTEAFGEMFFNT
ncbi:uncharacterized protein LOC115080379 [Rhinatrema bivittatum]|uniref:uncharacterized protein LOC115080379 n=1 Tax=Rhinatrema bivittatum TaxID=194408 RepID=UPI00112AF8CC|nr:uncharacterized protein LOC115080379 [Rhinatrema bivittatum]